MLAIISLMVFERLMGNFIRNPVADIRSNRSCYNLTGFFRSHGESPPPPSSSWWTSVRCFGSWVQAWTCGAGTCVVSPCSLPSLSLSMKQNTYMFVFRLGLEERGSGVGWGGGVGALLPLVLVFCRCVGNAVFTTHCYS